MAEDKNFDVKDLVDRSGEKLTVDELKKKGFERINVIDKNTFNRLISQAVERIISTRTNLLSDREREKIFEASQNELKMLMSEHQTLQKTQELSHRDKESIIGEVQNLQKQLQLARKIAEEQAQSRYEAGMESQQPLIQEYRGRIESLEKENEQFKGQAATVQQSAASTDMMDQMKQMQEQMQANMAEMTTTIQSNMDERMKSIEETVNMREEQIQAEIQAKLEEAAKTDDRVGANMESLMKKMTDSLGKKIQSIKSGHDEDLEFRPGALTLDEMLKTELESNLEDIESEEVETSSVSSTLDKLKSLRGGGKKKDE
jgi:hypothetical protein